MSVQPEKNGVCDSSNGNHVLDFEHEGAVYSTVTSESRQLSRADIWLKKFEKKPMEIYIDDEAKLTLHGLVQHYIKLTELEKNRKLNDLLDALDFNQIVIFVKSVNRAAELNKLLVECNFPSICIHYGMSLEERLMRYKGFKEGHKRILVATNLVGRGIDIEGVNIVINYDMPDSADSYLHRLGRPGRFGTKELAITFVSSSSDSEVLNQVQERFEVDIKELPENIDTSTYKSGQFSGADICLTKLERKLYIIFMGAPRSDYDISNYKCILKSVVRRDCVGQCFGCSYNKLFNGFAANITDDEAKIIAGMEGIVSVFPSKKIESHTSRIWEGLGLTEEIQTNNIIEHTDIVIGVIDTGINYNSESFSEVGISPLQRQWEENSDDWHFFTTRKIVGARMYKTNCSDPDSIFDNNGHGTNCAAVAAGNFVNASLGGLKNGLARGGVPGAKISVYKLEVEQISDGAVLSAIADAVNDNVDIISISMGGQKSKYQHNYVFEIDGFAIGSLYAAQKDILCCMCAGNFSSIGSVINGYPWVLSVGACNSQERLVTKVTLGNDQTIEGYSLNLFPDTETCPLIHYNDIWITETAEVDHQKIKDKIIVCKFNKLGKLVTGAVGIIVMEDDDNKANFSLDYFACANVSKSDGEKIVLYMEEHSEQGTASAKISLTEEVKNEENEYHVLSSYSSKGPNLFYKLLKPDICAPGDVILTASSPKQVFIDKDEKTNEKHPYNIVSGTSMATPIVAGAAAYVKSKWPLWSAAAIKSALMTSAEPLKMKRDDDPYGMGNGVIKPLKAVQPGLIYDIQFEDYMKYLLGLGYSETKVNQLSMRRIGALALSESLDPWNLNLPSFYALLDEEESHCSVQFERKVRNVGELVTVTYNSRIEEPPGIQIEVKPATLSFNDDDKEREFTLNVIVKDWSKSVSNAFSGCLEWSDGVHKVRSNILIVSRSSLSIAIAQDEPSHKNTKRIKKEALR